MSEHAFDPMPDEEVEVTPNSEDAMSPKHTNDLAAAGIVEGGPLVIAGAAAVVEEKAEEKAPAPTAIITRGQLRYAIQKGAWAHEVPGTELWLNTSFPPKGRDEGAFADELSAYGIRID